MGGEAFDCQPIRLCRILATPPDPTRRSKLMTNRLFTTCSGWCAVAALALAAPVDASAQVDLEALQDEAVAWLQEYIGITMPLKRVTMINIDSTNSQWPAQFQAMRIVTDSNSKGILIHAVYPSVKSRR